MPRRTRLRTRIFSMTALYAVVLIAMAFVLSWRARAYEREFSRLASVESRLIRPLDDFGRRQMSWAHEWTSMVDKTSAEVSDHAASYFSMMQSLDSDNLRGADLDRVRVSAQELSAFATRVASQWDWLDYERRIGAIEEIARLSNAVFFRAESARNARAQEKNAALERLEYESSSTMWIALGVTWIIAVSSFVVARRTLTKVVRPLENLTRAAGRIAAGDLESHAPVGGDREIAQLGESFNRMTVALRESHAELARRARTDELTGLPNFRAFREAIESEVERSDRYGHSFGILVLDLDRFKQYNDTYGHQAGNDALKGVAETLRQSVRHVDIPARYGGEEFAVIVPATEPEGLALLAERVRAEVEWLPPIEDRRRLTVSVGGALYPDEAGTVEELFALADRRLYEAKEAGRNRSVT